MSQNDFNLANQGFPSMRADINSGLQALATNSSGATAPSTTYAYQWWYDTDSDILKIRNEGNDAWVDFATFDQAADTFSISPSAISGASIESSVIGSTTPAAGAFTTATADNVSDGTTSVPTGYVVNGSAKAWINFNGTGTVAIRDSLNVSSLTDNSTGVYTVNYSSSFSNADYSFAAGVDVATAVVATIFSTTLPPTSSAITLRSYASNFASVDTGTLTAQIHGDLA